MTASVETLSGLERKIEVSVPSDQIEQEVKVRLKRLAARAKIDGFRPGKVPFHIIRQRYEQSVREEAAMDSIQSSLYEAFDAHQIFPAGTPKIDPDLPTAGQDFVYRAIFEVFPSFDIVELNDSDAVELVRCDVSDDDVEQLIEKLREQHKHWVAVDDRPAQDKDRVTIDFEGFIDGELIEKGSAKDFQLELGSQSMIPGFESGLMGATVGQTLELAITFPENYSEASLASKDAVFNVTVKKIEAPELPPVDDAFAEKFNITEGGVPALKEDLKKNMHVEAHRRVGLKNRQVIFNAVAAKHDFDVPSALVDKEIEQLKHELYHRVFGPAHHEDEKIPDFPRELFEPEAKKRVKMGLLFAEYVKKHEVVVDPNRVEAMIERLSTTYTDPSEFRDWVNEKKDRIVEIETLVLEEMVSEKMTENASVTYRTLSFDSLVNTPDQDA